MSYHCYQWKEQKKRFIREIFSALYGLFYNSKCLKSDLAILELNEEIDESVANYACLPHKEIVDMLNLKELRVYGWGTNRLFILHDTILEHFWTMVIQIKKPKRVLSMRTVAYVYYLIKLRSQFHYSFELRILLFIYK